MKNESLLFVSTNNADYGGSDVLWAETAERLARAGHAVACEVSAQWRAGPHAGRLSAAGVEIRLRRHGDFWSRVKGRLGRIRSAALREEHGLVLINEGMFGAGHGIAAQCRQVGLRYAILSHAVAETRPIRDVDLDSVSVGIREAAVVFFVSNQNHKDASSQIGEPIPHGEVTINPFNVRYDASVDWPTSDAVSLACVARLDSAPKGQDLLLKVLAMDHWRARPLTVSFFGRGRQQKALEKEASRLGLESVRWRGHVDSIEDIWRDHHALILPSRFEGLPLALVEAMLCSRPALVTEVAGMPELIEDGQQGYLAEAPTVRHLNDALERLWVARENLQAMGVRAAEKVKQNVPPDPVSVFADRLICCLGGD
ncbi:MAG: glycosyltransferase family 4 protein [Planctomycetota bacterium]